MDIGSTFSIIMGTGLGYILLHSILYNGVWLYWLPIDVSVLDVFLFVSSTIASIMRYVLCRKIWGLIIQHPTQYGFLEAFQMGEERIRCLHTLTKGTPGKEDRDNDSSRW